MGIDHSNPYIHSTTVLCDRENIEKVSKKVSKKYPAGWHKIDMYNIRYTDNSNTQYTLGSVMGGRKKEEFGDVMISQLVSSLSVLGGRHG